MENIITISTLPSSIRSQIPYSIKKFSNEHNFSDLPYNIQEIVRDYLESKKDVEYDLVYDVNPKISIYGDFTTLENIYDLVIEYLKNYLSIGKESYPFDPNFYSKLKEYIQKRDTNLQHKLVSAEIQNIVDSISEDLSIPISVSELNIFRENNGYVAKVKLKINNTVSPVSINVI